ncbi:alpha/beta hydrolase [Mesorhizobium sp. DCY119]|uniref:alpha/beta fold hydrolase n=1 Tax=Mesorhizobium sp. DCY119 TaxID=2108445 RepID=UPI001FDF7123|nr:alpha/beta hydrolase [Mesorhizobium sp. DCY119]
MTTGKDAPTRSVGAAGTTFVYRQLGPAVGVPVILLNHWGATLDNFDPCIVDGLARTRPVVAINYRGVGGSGGKAPLKVAEMAEDTVAVIRALGFKEVDLIGFSLGGFVVQQIVLDHPELIRKVILAGTGPAGGEGIERVGPVSWPLMMKGMLTFTDPKKFLFFTATTNGRRAAKAFLERLKERKADRDKPATIAMLLRQLKAIHAWGRQPPQDLSGIGKPVLVANGDHGIMVPTPNSVDLVRRLPNTELVIYKDAGHGGIFQNHEAFVSKVVAFVDA